MCGMSVLEGLWGKNTDKDTRQRSGVFILFLLKSNLLILSRAQIKHCEEKGSQLWDRVQNRKGSSETHAIVRHMEGSIMTGCWTLDPDRSGVYRQYSCSVGCMYTAGTLPLAGSVCAVYKNEQPILQVHCIGCSVATVYTAWHCIYTPLRSGWALLGASAENGVHSPVWTSCRTSRAPNITFSHCLTFDIWPT